MSLRECICSRHSTLGLQWPLRNDKIYYKENKKDHDEN